MEDRELKIGHEEIIVGPEELELYQELDGNIRIEIENEGDVCHFTLQTPHEVQEIIDFLTKHKRKT